MKQQTRISIAVAALFSLAAAQGAFAQGFGPYPTKKGEAPKAAATSAVAADDVKFMEKAAAGAMMEVELGKIAQQRAANPQVKQFAARMVQDHSKAGEELKKIAAAKGVALPPNVSRKHRKDIDELKTLAAARFDAQYMEFMVKDHREDIKEFDKQAKSGRDTEVKAFAAKTLPTLHEHLKLAEAAESAARSAKK